ncbi:MAG: methyltransferase domain-containing protein [Microthrixaceae bacterium]|nr:methyltransferase domain-containing protein [Microthrixaceae bacterium]
MDRYTHGHSDPVLRSHRWRTARNSAAYLLDELAPGQHLLDVGCGPGNLTADLARFVDPGTAVGVDVAPGIIEVATGDNPRSESPNLSFRVADTYGLDFDDDTFDVVHAHQVLQHLSDPVAALQEMRRVLKPGGTLAVRDADYRAFMWSPGDPRLDRWQELYHQVTLSNGAEANAGRHLFRWAMEAGFEEVRYSTSNWVFCTPEDRGWWGNLWAERVQESDFSEQALEGGLSDPSELAAIAEAFRAWAADPHSVFVVPNGEVLASA